MKTITIRDLRQRWPEAEAMLRAEKELVVTRDAKPIARLTLWIEDERPRKRFDPEAHGRWQAEAGEPTQWVDKYLGADRDGRKSET